MYNKHCKLWKMWYLTTKVESESVCVGKDGVCDDGGDKIWRKQEAEGNALVLLPVYIVLVFCVGLY